MSSEGETKEDREQGLAQEWVEGGVKCQMINRAEKKELSVVGQNFAG